MANACWFEINLLYRNVNISLGNFNLKNVRHSAVLYNFNVGRAEQFH